MNGPNTHGALLDLGNGMRAFVDGLPDECDHDYKDEVFISKSGKVIHWYTYRQWASLCSDARGRLIYEHHEEIGDPIIEGTSECRKCKKIYQPPFFDMD